MQLYLSAILPVIRRMIQNWRHSVKWCITGWELEAFRQVVHNRLGYENILFGTAVENNECEQIKAMLLLNKAA